MHQSDRQYGSSDACWRVGVSGRFAAHVSRLTLASLKNYLTLQQLNSNGPKVLLWENWKSFMQTIAILDSFLSLPYVVWRCHLPEKQQLPNLRHISFLLLVLHYKMSDREHPLTLKQCTKECSSVKTDEDLFFSNLMSDFSRIVQCKDQYMALGSSLEPYFDSFIPFYAFNTQLGSMLTISFFYFRNQLQPSNFHWLSFYSESLTRVFHRTSGCTSCV